MKKENLKILQVGMYVSALICFGLGYYLGGLDWDNEKELIQNTKIINTTIQNPYNDSLIFFEIGHIKRSQQQDYIFLLDKIKGLEERIDGLDFIIEDKVIDEKINEGEKLNKPLPIIIQNE